MTRCAPYMDATQWLVPQLAARLLIMLYTGAQVGYVARNRTRTAAHDLNVVAIDAVAPVVADTASGSKDTEPSDVARPKSMRAEKACLGELYTT